MAEVKIKKKKRESLIQFQEKLNIQFEGLSNSESLIITESKEDRSNELGLLIDVDKKQWFISLKDLKSVENEHNLENIFITKKWISGFSHLHGDVFTVIDWQNFINKEKITDSNQNNSLLLFKEFSNLKLAFLVANANLEYTAEYVLLFKYLDNNKDNTKDNKIGWKLSEDIQDAGLDSFIRPELLTDEEKNLLYFMKSNKRPVLADFQLNSNGSYMHEKNPDLLLYFIKDCFLDSFGKRPVFYLDIASLAHFLTLERPY